MSTSHENDFFNQLGPVPSQDNRPQWTQPTSSAAAPEQSQNSGQAAPAYPASAYEPQFDPQQHANGYPQQSGPDTGPIAPAERQGAHHAEDPARGQGFLHAAIAGRNQQGAQVPQGPHSAPSVYAPGPPTPGSPRYAGQPDPQFNPNYYGMGPGEAQLTASFGSAAVVRNQRKANDLQRAVKRPPKRGWRKWLYSASFHTINPGESPDEIEVRLLETAIKSPISGQHSVTVLGGKGGCGKTSATVSIASVFARIRQKDPVLAADADTAQAANLPDRIAPEASATYADVLSEEVIERNSDLRNYVGQNLESGLDVLAAPARVGGHADLDAETYAKAHERLQKLYNLLFSDTGVDFHHPVMSGVLSNADSLVMVASTAPDGLAGANIALAWLDHHGYKHFETQMVIVINNIREARGRKERKRTARQVEEMKADFIKRVPAERIFELPFDPHIAEAGVVDLDLLRPKTRRTLMRIAAAVAGGFGATSDGRR
ncbi:MinD/ParA family ATP-binding protein [Mycobacteroides abscessus]|uniref:MinD/ParA family ATP-binding protein n=2 Tax=Mycobacteroides abscessus TaxID=36809 RepID=UPI000C25736A|nr:MinD/ParA family protein [Mycobacteroides abscessus]MBN7374144.1 MinD/ParA family protein [Mycobacteroides abscessus subsp. abscessus]RIR16441.1 MinD/ParA family protein [Mycobacteroides abscessus]